MSDSQEGKIKLAFFVAIVGVTLTVLGMGTEFWVELAQPKDFSGNQTCQMAHYGLWKGCVCVLVLLSVLIFHQSVLALLSSDHSIPLHHELSWSVACVGSAGAILIFGGFLFIILALPFSPWQRCFPHKNSTT
uniref:Calcium channel, voltage-dependent, gamma subunit 6b n=1 Tax=Nothobranchius kuhntae TaxID=321403 RepID=A0A1A8IZM8_NOTKU